MAGTQARVIAGRVSVLALIGLALAGCSSSRATSDGEPAGFGWLRLPTASSEPAPAPTPAPTATPDAPRPGLTASSVRGRQVCPPASNGAPNCERAAELLCQSKGFATGTPVDIETTRGCSTADLRRQITNPNPVCPATTSVRRALCR